MKISPHNKKKKPLKVEAEDYFLDVTHLDIIGPIKGIINSSRRFILTESH